MFLLPLIKIKRLLIFNHIFHLSEIFIFLVDKHFAAQQQNLHIFYNISLMVACAVLWSGL